jgi:hypothetical protein
MRIDAPDGSWHVIMRGPGELNGGDFKALQRIDDKVSGLDKGIWLGEGDSEYEMSPDGLSMVKREARRHLSRATIDEAANIMLGRLVKDWSLSGSMPMPWQPTYLDSDDVPLEMAEAIRKALDDVSDRIRQGGPKETPETSPASATTSPGESTAPLPE